MSMKLPPFGVTNIYSDRGRASVVLIFVLFVLAILSNESIDNMPFKLCTESKFQYKYSNLSCNDVFKDAI